MVVWGILQAAALKNSRLGRLPKSLLGRRLHTKSVFSGSPARTHPETAGAFEYLYAVFSNPFDYRFVQRSFQSLRRHQAVLDRAAMFVKLKFPPCTLDEYLLNQRDYLTPSERNKSSMRN